MESLLIKIGSWLITPFLLVASLFSPTVEAPQPMIDQQAAYVEQAPAKEINVGAALPSATGVFETTLQTPINSTATSMTLAANSIRGGGSISGYTCFTLDEGSAQAEVVCGTVSGTAVTGMTRGISYADGISSVTANKFQHRRGVSIKITDFPIIQILKAQNNGEVTFPNPLTYESGIGPVSGSDLTDKDYVLSVVNGGAVSHDQEIIAGTAGETVAAGNLIYFDETQNEWMKTDADTLSTVYNVKLGIAQGSGTDGNTITGGVLVAGVYTTSGLTKGDLVYAGNTAGAFVSGTSGTTPRVIGIAKDSTTLNFDPNFQNTVYNYGLDAVGTDAYAITLPGSYSAYYVGELVRFKAGTLNTGAATLNINGLGAKTIKKATTGVTTDLSTGDILANQIVVVVYDGTNFQIVSKTPSLAADLIGTIPVSVENSLKTRFYVTDGNLSGSAATNTVTVSHALGILPTLIRVTAHYKPDFNNATGILYGDSDGIATLASGTPTYHGNYGFILNNGNGSGAAASCRGTLGSSIMFIGLCAGNDMQATIANVTTSQLDLVFTKSGTGVDGGNSNNSIYWTIEVAY